MEEDTTYNGWRNYETWCVALWLDNEAGSSRYWREQAQECWNEAPDSGRVREWGFSRIDAAKMELAKRLEEAIHDGNPLQEASLYSDLLGSAVAGTDWYEIAGHYVDDVVDEAERLGKEKTT